MPIRNGELCFTVKSGYLTISDTEHPKDFHFALRNIPARNGRWAGTVFTTKYPEFGNRVRGIILRHLDEEIPDHRKVIKAGDLCIDYGTAAICDSEDYMPIKVQSGPFAWRKVRGDKMLIVSTGFGAGMYTVLRNDLPESTWITIDFIAESGYEEVLSALNDISQTSEKGKRSSVKREFPVSSKRRLVVNSEVSFYMLGTINAKESKKANRELEQRKKAKRRCKLEKKRRELKKAKEREILEAQERELLEAETRKREVEEREAREREAAVIQKNREIIRAAISAIRISAEFKQGLEENHRSAIRRSIEMKLPEKT